MQVPMSDNCIAPRHRRPVTSVTACRHARRLTRDACQISISWRKKMAGNEATGWGLDGMDLDG
jgi:hypothetical protein